MKLLIALLASVMFLSACDQDPLKNASDAIKNGVPPKTDVPIEKPIDKEGLQIDLLEDYNTRVGVAVELTIQGRVMVEGVSYQINIENLADFPGATFDAATGIFKWTPTKASVGTLPWASYKLNAVLCTEPTAKLPKVSCAWKSSTIFVENTYTRPIINKIEGNANLKSGFSTQMTFTVEDVDSLNATDMKIIPRDCEKSTWVSSIANFVKVKSITPDVSNPGTYNGVLTIDLYSANLKTNDYCFALAAVSKFGIMSEPYDKRVSIESKLSDTRISAKEVYLNVGEKINFSFSIFDPSGEGKVSLVSKDDPGTVLPGSTLTCAPAAMQDWMINCQAVIDATALTAPTSKQFTIKAQNQSKSYGSTQKIENSFTLFVTVKAAQP